jgi:hypothetical protein
MRPLIAALALGLTAGCVVHRHGGHSHVHGPPVAVTVGHAHDDHCGHYYRGGRWYHHGGHRHQHGCGHHFQGGLWISVD